MLLRSMEGHALPILEPTSRWLEIFQSMRLDHEREMFFDFVLAGIH